MDKDKSETEMPHMAASLRVIISDVISRRKYKKYKWAKSVNARYVLRRFVEKGLVYSIRVADGRRTWFPGPDLIDSYEVGDVVRVRKALPARIRLDETLRELADFYYRERNARPGSGVSRRRAAIAMLITHEFSGDVTGHLDEKGRLAWKATDQFIQWWRRFRQKGGY